MNKQEREVLKSLIQIVWADGEVDERERLILGKMLAELDLSQKDLREVGEMMTHAQDLPDFDVILAKNPDEKMDLMKLLLALSMSKGHLNPPEMRYVQTIAQKLDISREQMDRLVAEVRKLPEQR